MATLQRSGLSYSAVVQLVDGNSDTSWSDYTHYRAEIVDLNDSDGDGVPDLSDPPGTCDLGTDTDNDGVVDACDNCTLGSNPGQEDANVGTDDDSSLPRIQHYGDRCDADLNNDGVVNAADFFGFFRPCFGANVAASPECAASDFDGSGGVSSADFFGVFRPALGGPPGPGVTEPRPSEVRSTAPARSPSGTSGFRQIRSRSRAASLGCFREVLGLGEGSCPGTITGCTVTTVAGSLRAVQQHSRRTQVPASLRAL